MVNIWKTARGLNTSQKLTLHYFVIYNFTFTAQFKFRKINHCSTENND